MKAWLQKMLAEGDGSPSTKRVLFALTVVTGLCVFVADFCLHGITNLGIQLFASIMLATGGAYIGGRFAETKDSPVVPDTTQPPRCS